jgi:nicotinamidase-related amidase
LPNHICFEANNSTDLPENLFYSYQQIIFEKRGNDTFLQPRADRLLSEYAADEFIVFGTGIETAIHKTVLGLLSRGKNVSVITDAISGSTRIGCQMSLRKMAAKGACLKETEEITGKSRLNGSAHFYAKKLSI